MEGYLLDGSGEAKERTRQGENSQGSLRSCCPPFSLFAASGQRQREREDKLIIDPPHNPPFVCCVN